MAQFKKTPAHAIEGLNGLNLEQQLTDHENRIKELSDQTQEQETRLTDLELRPHGELETGGHLASQIKSDADLMSPSASGRSLENYLTEIRKARGGYPSLSARLSALSGKGYTRTWRYFDDFLDYNNTLDHLEVEPRSGGKAALTLGHRFTTERSLNKNSAAQYQRTQPRNLVMGNANNQSVQGAAKWVSLRFAPTEVYAVRMVIYANGGLRDVPAYSGLGVAEVETYLADAKVPYASASASIAPHGSYPISNIMNGAVSAGDIANSTFFLAFPTWQRPIMIMTRFDALTLIDRFRFVHTDAATPTRRQPRDFEIQFTTDPNAKATDDPRSPRWFGLDLLNGKADGSEKAYADEADQVEATLASLPGIVLSEPFDTDRRFRFDPALAVGANTHSEGQSYVQLGLGNTTSTHQVGLSEVFKDGVIEASFTTGENISSAASMGFGIQFRGYGPLNGTGSLGYVFKVYGPAGGGQAKAVLQYWNGTAWINASAPVDIMGVSLISNITYNLKVEARGNVFRGFVDGVQVLAWTDTFHRFVSGQASFVAWNIDYVKLEGITVTNLEAPYGERQNIDVSGNAIKLAESGGSLFTSGRWTSEPIHLDGREGGVLRSLSWITAGEGIQLSYRLSPSQKTQMYKNVALQSNGGSVKLLTGHAIDANEVIGNLIKGTRKPWNADGTVFAADLRTVTPGTSGEKVSAIFSFDGAYLISKITHVNVDVFGAKRVKVWAGLSETELDLVGEYDLTTYEGPGVSGPSYRLYTDDITFRPVYAQVVKLEWTPNPNRISGTFNASSQFNSNYLAVAAVEIYSEPILGLDRAPFFDLQVGDSLADFFLPPWDNNHWLQLRADLIGDGTTTPELQAFQANWSETEPAASGFAILRVDSGSNGTRYSEISYQFANMTQGASAQISYRTGDELEENRPWNVISRNVSNVEKNVAYAGNGGKITYLGDRAVSAPAWMAYRAINGVEAWDLSGAGANFNVAEINLAGSSAIQPYVTEFDSEYTISSVDILGNKEYGPREVILSSSLNGVDYDVIGTYQLQALAGQLNKNKVLFDPVVARFVKFELVPNRTDYLSLVQLKVWGQGAPLNANGRWLELRVDLSDDVGTSLQLLDAAVDYQIDPTAATEKSILGLHIDLDRARFEFQSYKQKRHYNLNVENLNFLLSDSTITGWGDTRYPIYDTVRKVITLDSAKRRFGDWVTLSAMTASAGAFDELVLLTHSNLTGGSIELELTGVPSGSGVPVTKTILLEDGIKPIHLVDFVGCVSIAPKFTFSGSAELKCWGIIHR